MDPKPPAPTFPFFFRQLIDHTREGYTAWTEVRPNVFTRANTKNVNVVIRSREGDGEPPYVVEISSPFDDERTETWGNSGDPSYDDRFGVLFALAKASATGAARPSSG